MLVTLAPWDILTDFERRKNRFKAQEILKFLQFHGYKVSKWVEWSLASIISFYPFLANWRRFFLLFVAVSRLVLGRIRSLFVHSIGVCVNVQSFDRQIWNGPTSATGDGEGLNRKTIRVCPAGETTSLSGQRRSHDETHQAEPQFHQKTQLQAVHSRRQVFRQSQPEWKFLSVPTINISSLNVQVVLPLMQAYFVAHRNYFLVSSGVSQTGVASNKEKEMIAR